MEMESWESLDIDDSDLHPPLTTPPPLSKPLLPCKRPQPQAQTSAPASPPITLTPKPHRIPGPAGAVQAAMHRKAHNDQIFRENFASTQDFLRRAIEDDGNSGGEDEVDFKTNSWLCAVGDVGWISSLSIASIKIRLKRRVDGRGVDRVPQVVAMVKSFSPNGLGAATATLKDPTGTIGASIHHKVLTHNEFGKDISVGSVLILQEVVVFSPSPSTYYLNITQKNVTKVFSKDSGPPTSNCQPALQIRAASASIAGLTKRPANLTLGTIERVTNEASIGYTNYKGSVDLERRANEHSLLAAKFSRTASSSRSLHSVVEVEPLRTQNAPREATTEPSKGDGVQREKIASSQTVNIASQPSSSAAAPNDKNSDDDDETRRAAEALNQKSQLKTALPEWTDEQLEELFAASCDDW